MTEQRREIDFDRWVELLQAEILRREQEMFSARVLAEARDPQNLGAIADPDGQARVLGPCGDTMEIFVRLRDSQIETATFLTDGCGPTVACGSMVTQMVRGKGLDEAAALEGADVILALDGLPPEHVHCATLAANTLRRAVAACESKDEKGAG